LIFNTFSTIIKKIKLSTASDKRIMDVRLKNQNIKGTIANAFTPNICTDFPEFDQ
jgi:hypothetical protein